MCEAEQGRMLEFVRSLEEDIGKEITETIVDAFVIHKLESSEDPMELLRDLAQQRVQVLGQQGRRRNLKVGTLFLFLIVSSKRVLSSCQGSFDLIVGKTQKSEC
eukprot:492663-Rhodomonas_salina.1